MMPPRPWPTREQALAALHTGTGAGVQVAILDTGVDAAHPWLAGLHLTGSWKADVHASTEVAPEDPVGHGTAIAGIIHRLAPAAAVLAIRVLGADQRQQRHEVIRRGAHLAIAHGAAILNCSFGVPGTAYTLPLYKAWTDHAFHAGRLVVAASSNLDPDAPEWPAFFPQVLAVTAAECPPETVGWRDQQPVPLTAAGDGIRVPAPGGGESTVSGSSFAAAHVSGLLARLLSQFPGLSPSLAREALEHLARQAS